MKFVIISVVLLASLNACSLVVSGVVGAAVTPFVQPMVDRILGAAGLDFIDPGGVSAVKSTQKD